MFTLDELFMLLCTIMLLSVLMHLFDNNYNTITMFDITKQYISTIQITRFKIQTVKSYIEIS